MRFDLLNASRPLLEDMALRDKVLLLLVVLRLQCYVCSIKFTTFVYLVADKVIDRKIRNSFTCILRFRAHNLSKGVAKVMHLVMENLVC